ncbi:MAG TPA: hypothetical protein VHW01_11240 [Polyangiaceae bacterium]|nr:hypothetical protein [Polyangiaceae bacterium]
MSNSRLLLALVTLCSACGGSSFEAGGGGAGGTSAQAGASNHAGDTSSAGASSGGSGADSSAGASGQSTGGAATAGAGGSSGGTGGSAGADCAVLKTEYTAALEKARVCDMGSTDQCDKSSTLPNIGGCGCPTLVNTKSEATTLAKQKYQAFQNAKCALGQICNIACLAYTSATCSAQTTGTGFVCTGSNAGIAN